MEPSPKAHPQLKRIVSEIEMHGSADAALPEGRFEYWQAVLASSYPRSDNQVLYGQILTLALTFAAWRATAATQLFQLALLHSSPDEVEQAAQKSSVFRRFIAEDASRTDGLKPLRSSQSVSLSGRQRL